MVKMPSQLGELAVPRASRGIATINTGQVFQAQREGAQAVAAGYGALGEGFQAASNALYRRKLEDEDREVKQLDVELTKRRREINAEFRKTQGQSTIDARPTLDKKYNQARDELLKKATSSKVKSAFTLIADGKAQADLEQQDGYTEIQRRQANMDASEAVMTEAYNSAIEAPLDEAVSVLSMRQIQDEVLSQAQIQGWTDEVTQQKMDTAVSQLYAQRINAAAINNPDAAWQIYRANKEDIQGKDRIEVEKMLETVTLDTIAQGAAAEAIAAYPGNVAAQRKHIQETLTGKQEEAALSKLREELEFNRGEVRWNEYLKDQAYQEIARADALDQRNQRIATDSAQDDLNAYLREKPGVNTRSQWEKLNPEGAEALNKDVYKSNTMDALQTRLLEESQYAEVTKSESVSKYAGMGIPELAAVTETELQLEQANMTQPDWNKFARKVGAAKASMEAATNASGKYYTAADNALARLAPKTAKGKNKLKPELYDAIQLELHAWVTDQINEGKIPKHEDLERETQRLLMPISGDPANTVPPAIFGLAVPYAGQEEFDGIVAEYKKMSAEQKAVATVPIDDIPDYMLEDIKKILAAKGITESDELIEQLAAATALNDLARIHKLLGIK
jgi:hypothetical protein